MGSIALLRRGLVVLNSSLGKKGVIIDWGTTGVRYREYLPANTDIDAVRVWTGQDIEIWPLSETFSEEVWQSSAL